MTWHVEVEHVAGILEGSARIEPGLNAVRGANWQGKSSFVAAIAAGLGVSRPLTEGSDRGRVRLDMPDRTVEVELVRGEEAVRRHGEPYLTDEYDVARAELFACLGETNEVRRAVRQGENLESVLLGPLDFQNIDERIAELKDERERVESELAQAREARKRLPTVEERVARLESELADLRRRHEALEAEHSGECRVQSSRSDLASARSERDRAETRIERLEGSIERTESKLEEKRAALSEIEVASGGETEQELADARAELDGLERDLEVLQSVYSASEMVLEENRIDLVTDVRRGLAGDAVACWTCGSEVDRSDVENQLEELGERIATLSAEVDEHRETVELLRTRHEEIERSRRRKRELESAVADLEDKLADQREQLATARESRRQAAERVEELADAVDETVAEITDVESDIKYREAELTEARDERDSLERRAGRVATLTEERESLRAEIENLRNRKDEIEYETREAFDAAMGEVLGRFDAGFETARLTPEFELVVARDGQEASLDALSEGELELLGFVAALAGYEAFDVADTVPAMLVDGVGGLDDENHHTLIEYLHERTEYLVFTAYPEHGDFDGTEVDPGEWTIATDPSPAAR
jgi:peptidoglycan hydrolase CwlO-like protein